MVSTGTRWVEREKSEVRDLDMGSVGAPSDAETSDDEDAMSLDYGNSGADSVGVGGPKHDASGGNQRGVPRGLVRRGAMWCLSKHCFLLWVSRKSSLDTYAHGPGNRFLYPR